MTHEYVLWIATAAYGFHMIEETIYDWHGWVRRVLKLQAEWSEFYLVNGVVFVLGLSCAMVGWRLPAFALVFPAFMLVNAILFHILPTIVTRIFSPGVIIRALPIWTAVEHPPIARRRLPQRTLMSTFVAPVLPLP